MDPVPASRIRVLRDVPVQNDGEFVLYWMTAYRRTTNNFALDRACWWSAELGKPLVVLEALSVDYEFASERLHAFVLDGMAQNAEAITAGGALAYPYVEPSPGAGKGLVESLAAHACLVVGDDAPIARLPVMLERLAPRLATRFEVVDSNGLIPIRSDDRVFSRAYDYRRFVQAVVLDHLDEIPSSEPFSGIPAAPNGLLNRFLHRWPSSIPGRSAVASLQLDRLPPTNLLGGSAAGRGRLREFLANTLPSYPDRSHPDDSFSSGLSPYLHFGHVSAHEIFEELATSEGWDPSRCADKGKGQRSGWWGMSEAAEGFVDQFVTWRELGFHTATKLADYDSYESLPRWALETLREHAHDHREHVYSFEEFDRGLTHDAVWNAAQTQLRTEGIIQNYMRMLWGKKILHWSATPQDAFVTMMALNDRYCLDGRDPNSVSGVAWVMGRYDRPWPEREIFGKVRYMTSASTMRKLRAKRYVERYSPQTPLF